MENIEIKKATSSDVQELHEISTQTFSETFSAVNSEENIKKYLEEELSEKKLASELGNDNSEFYFALLNDKVIGYLKLNFGEAQTELKENKGVEIERIYVLKEYLGKKAGQILYEKAIQRAAEKHADYIWLGVWEENERAISFYRKNGFIQFDKHIFMLGDDKQTDIMMKLELKR